MANTNEYMKTYMAKRRAQRRRELWLLLGGECARCGYDGDAFDFDHVKPGSRSFRLSGRGLDKNWNTVLDEAAKCQVLCKPCHVKKTVECGESGGGWSKNQAALLHGSPRTYQELPCRCDSCKLAKNMYRNKELAYSDVIR